MYLLCYQNVLIGSIDSKSLVFPSFEISSPIQYQ